MSTISFGITKSLKFFQLMANQQDLAVHFPAQIIVSLPYIFQCLTWDFKILFGFCHFVSFLDFYGAHFFSVQIQNLESAGSVLYIYVFLFFFSHTHMKVRIRRNRFPFWILHFFFVFVLRCCWFMFQRKKKNGGQQTKEELEKEVWV